MSEAFADNGTHWQVRIRWIDGGRLHEGSAWISKDEAGDWLAAVGVCRGWRGVGDGAVIIHVDVDSCFVTPPRRAP